MSSGYRKQVECYTEDCFIPGQDIFAVCNHDTTSFPRQWASCCRNLKCAQFGGLKKFQSQIFIKKSYNARSGTEKDQRIVVNCRNDRVQKVITNFDRHWKCLISGWCFLWVLWILVTNEWAEFKKLLKIKDFLKKNPGFSIFEPPYLNFMLQLFSTTWCSLQITAKPYSPTIYKCTPTPHSIIFMLIKKSL